MINFSKLRGPVGGILRGILKFLPASLHVPILQGYLCGKKWIRGAGVNGYWLGTYEIEEQNEFVKNVMPGDVVFDIGAHVGFYSLLASTIVGQQGRVFAFEPLPENVAILEKHLTMNKADNVNIINVAVGEKEGRASFKKGESNFEGKLADDGDVAVNVVSLDGLLARGECPRPQFIKVDVEGKFLEVIRGGRETIGKYLPTIIFEAEFGQDKEVFEELERFGYKIFPIETGDTKTSLNFLAKI